MPITINRMKPFFSPDPKRVIVRFFMPGGEHRAKKIITRIDAMREEDALQVLNQILREFSNRHRNITRIFMKHYDRIAYLFEPLGVRADTLSKERKLLIGAYFTHEYSIESAAFFNPSMVEDPDQSHLESGQKRVIVSFRATGEGHVSSIAFRGAIIDSNNNLEFSPVSKLVDIAETIQLHEYSKADFLAKLHDLKLENTGVVEAVFNNVNETFLFRELRNSIQQYTSSHELTVETDRAISAIRMIADAQYQISFSLDTSISERVIFPVTDSESNGIEDARFVKFTEDDGTVKYYATYTAYNGHVIMPQMIETTDFYTFKVMPIYGKNAQNKGMALFPRKVNGKYAMLSRQDGENNYILFSDTVNNWDGDCTLLQEPEYPWEFVQLGNSGSPLETDKGWLVITHGVGAMRKYVLGAVLLDLHNPAKVIAKMSSPLLVANEVEREGYVPNVVYSCGSIIHNDDVLIPYAMSDTSSGFATVALKDLFDNLEYIEPIDSIDAAQAQRKILIVEDDPINTVLLSKILSDEGYAINTASDGLNALVEINKSNYDLILSDITMPNFTGYQLLDFLKTKNIEIPVVFLSGHTSEEDEIRGLQLGAIEYLRKPVRADLLRLRLKNIFA
ncbi:MAG: hypothetical protein RLY16_2756 [Bacteroidota bacterium]